MERLFNKSFSLSKREKKSLFVKKLSLSSVRRGRWGGFSFRLILVSHAKTARKLRTLEAVTRKKRNTAVLETILSLLPIEIEIGNRDTSRLNAFLLFLGERYS